jgi:hypothetical protein
MMKIQKYKTPVRGGTAMEQSCAPVFFIWEIC